MSDKAFAKMMGQIARENEAEQLREVRDQNRRKLMGKIRTAVTFLAFGALLTAGYLYREPLQKLAEDKFLSKPKVGKVEGGTGEALKGIQAAAEKRDQVLDQIVQK